MLAVGHSDQFESIWNNPQLYPQMFPWFFPYGYGGFSITSLSDKAHKKYLLMYHDKQFQTDINFPFVAFSHAQMKAATSQSFLLVDQMLFNAITERLLNLDQSVLSNIILSKGDTFKQIRCRKNLLSSSESFRPCFWKGTRFYHKQKNLYIIKEDLTKLPAAYRLF